MYLDNSFNKLMVPDNRVSRASSLGRPPVTSKRWTILLKRVEQRVSTYSGGPGTTGSRDRGCDCGLRVTVSSKGTVVGVGSFLSLLVRKDSAWGVISKKQPNIFFTGDLGGLLVSVDRSRDQNTLFR